MESRSRERRSFGMDTIAAIRDVWMRKKEKRNNERIIGHGGKNVLEEFQKKRNVVCQDGFYVFHITENERKAR